MMIYNNSGYLLLGRIIEKVTGKRYEDVVAELFAAAGMPDSRYCYYEDLRVTKRQPSGYLRRRTGFGRTPTDLPSIHAFAAGALCSTVDDLVTWNRALHGGRLLSARGYQQLVTPEQLSNGLTIRYAKGLQVDRNAGDRVFFHGGAIPGFGSELQFYPDDSLTVVVLMNTATSPRRMVQTIAATVLASRPVPAGKPYSGNLDDLLGRYTGPTRASEALTVAVTRVGDTLVVANEESGRPSRPVGARYVGDDTFDRIDGSTSFRFWREGGGGGGGGGRITALYRMTTSEFTRLDRR